MRIPNEKSSMLQTQRKVVNSKNTVFLLPSFAAIGIYFTMPHLFWEKGRSADLVSHKWRNKEAMRFF